MKQMKMLINGAWVDSISKEVIEVFNPSTHERIAEVPQGKAEDIKIAVEYAKEGYKINKSIPVKERAEYLKRASDLMLENLEDLRVTMVQENGKSWSWAEFEVRKSAEILSTIAETAKEPRGKPIQWMRWMDAKRNWA